MSALIVRLHPSEPTSAEDFNARYLVGLQIEAFDVSLDSINGANSDKLGSASFLPDD